MKIWDIIFRVIILIIGVIVIGFNVLLYNFCKQQKEGLNSVRDKQEVESEFNNNKFKYQQDQIERISKDLDDVRQQIKDQNDSIANQKDALLQEAEKRQQIESENKSIQISLVDIKAETDAIKQDIKGWQKDYVSVLAELEKKMDNSQGEIKSVEDNLVSLNIPELKENIKSLKADVEKITTPAPGNDIIATAPAPDKQIDRSQPGS
jgi:chromosome segregation ATPase